VEDDGTVVDLTAPDDAVHDQVERTDIRFVKRDERTQEPMANVAFLITSLTTGERHLAVTDENGIFDSSVFASHERTNANDAALTSDEASSSKTEVSASDLDAKSGVWFGGSASLNQTPIEGLAALPYDRYAVQELRCEANRGRALVSFELTTEFPKSRHNEVLDLGTIDDREEREPSIQTTATDEKTGSHEDVAKDTTGIVDIVTCEGLVPGSNYELRGTLMDAESGEPILDSMGNSIEATQQFVPTQADDSVAMPFETDGSAFEGKKVVVFESLYREGQEVANHRDLNSESQSVDYREGLSSNKENRSGQGGTPKTGDETACVAVGACAVLGCAGIILTLWHKRRE
jgi:hypothetical protein